MIPLKISRLCVVGFGLVCVVSVAQAIPVIFNSTESAVAADTIGFQGSGFSDDGSVWITRVSPSGVPGASTDISAVMQSDNYVAAQIPVGQSLVLYQAVVKDGSGATSAPVFINRARITSTEFPEVDPGRQFRLFGRNLVMPGATPSIRFVDNTTSVSTAGTVIAGGDRYVVTVQAPATLVSGRTYTIYYRNGLGGAMGEVAAPEPLLARAGGTDSFSLGVPWGADYAGFASNVYDVKTDSRLALHAVGNGVANDTAALQAAINAASVAGGGVVHLPAGTYRVATFGGTGGGVGLTMKSNVVLRGAGQTTTVIVMTPPASVTAHSGLISLPLGSSVMGISALTIESHTQITGTGKIYPIITTANNVTKFFVSQVTLDGKQWALGGIRLTAPNGAGHFLVRDCTIKNLRRDAFSIFTKDYGSAPNQTRHVYIRGCDFPNMMAGVTLGGHHIIVENNTLTYDGTYFNALSALGQTYVMGSRDRINVSGSHLVVLDNHFSHVGDPWVYGNDSENILGEDPAAPSLLGTASSGTATTLVDATRSWTADQFAGMDLVMMTGPGAGQARRVVSNNATSLTVSPAWAVAPSASDRYTITQLNVPHLLIKGNTMQDKRLMALISQGAYDIAIVDNTGVNSGTIVVRSGTSTAYPKGNPTLRTLIADNTLTATSSDKPSAIQVGSYHWEPVRWGTASFLDEIRRNTVVAMADEAYRAVVATVDYKFIHPAGDAPPQATVGVIFDRNSTYEANTAYGWTKGIDGLTVSNATTADAYRDTYDMAHRDGRVIPGASLTSDGAFTGDGSGHMEMLAIEIPTAVTIEGRLKTAANGPIFSNRTLGGRLVLSVTGGKLAVWDNNFLGGGVEASSNAVSDNAWHQFAWTSDGSVSEIFVDGVLRRSSTRSRQSSTGVSNFGYDQGSGQATRFNGKLGEFRIWDGVRTNAQLATYRDTKLAGDEPGLLHYWRMDEGGGEFAFNRVLATRLSEGLVGYWRLDEGTGSVAADSSGEGNTGTLVNSPTWVTGEIGHAASFNADTSHIQVPDSPSLSRQGSFTVHARVRIDSISASGPTNWRGIVSKGNPNIASKLGWELGTFAGSGSPSPIGFFLRRGSGSAVVNVYSDTGLTTGQFYSVDAVWDAVVGKTSIYVDGVLHASVSNSSAHAPSSDDLLIGKRASGGAFHGVIDDVKVFDRALSAREINELR